MIPVWRGFGFGLGVCSAHRVMPTALYMNSRERPQDPRCTGSVQGTRHDFHATEDWMYGREVAGKVLGASGAPKPFTPLKEKRP